MDLTSETEVANTRMKLARLQGRYEVLRNDTLGNQRLRELSMTSLKRLINQFTEEIARYECRASNRDRRDRALHSEREVALAQAKLHRFEDS